MKIEKTGFVLLLAFVSFFGLSQTALAGRCTDEVDALKTELQGGICNFIKACEGLSHKLDSANRKLEQGKYRQATHKLVDFLEVIEDMAMRKKNEISIGDYVALTDPHFGVALECIEAVSMDADLAPTPDPDIPVVY